MKLKGLMISATLAAALAVPGVAMAQWPDRPIRMIVPFGAGGAADTLGRAVAEEISRSLGQQVVAENVTGAGGVIGVTALANAAPDGYTIGVINVSTTVIAPASNPNVTYDPTTAFEYIAMLGGAPTVLAVNPKLGVNTIDELLAMAKAANPPMVYGSPGAATMSNLAPAKFFADTQTPVEHVPYRGAAEAVVDAIAGHIPMTGTTLSTARAQLNEGALIALAISTRERHPDFPNVPTFAEVGHPDVTSLTWFGLGAPAGTDPAVVARLNAEANRILQLPSVQERLQAEGFVLELMTPAEFLAYQLKQAELFGPIAKALVK